MKKYIVCNIDEITEKDKETNKPVLLWFDEASGKKSIKYVLRITESNDTSFREYIKYSESEILAARNSFTELKSISDKYITQNAFASKYLENGKSLFKRVHGVKSNLIQPNTTGYIVLDVTYDICKFSGAAIFNTEIGDTVDFFILDNALNSFSGAPIETYGANFPLNQFGFDVCMPGSGEYENTSNYDANLYKTMQVYCAYKNNSQNAKIVYMNVELHEVK